MGLLPSNLTLLLNLSCIARCTVSQHQEIDGCQSNFMTVDIGGLLKTIKMFVGMIVAVYSFIDVLDSAVVVFSRVRFNALWSRQQEGDN